MKNVWKYITISFLLLLGLGCAGVLYIFFVPGASVFHITYINNHIRKESSLYDALSISTIKLNTRAYNVEIVETEDEYIYLEAFSNSFGFVLDSHKNFELLSNLDNDVLSFTVIEPYGFATPNNSLIKLYLPTTESYDLAINNYKAKTTINTPNTTIDNLKYSTKKGDFNFANGTLLGDLNLNLGKSDFKISNNVTTNENDVSLKLTSGSFKGKNVVLGDITVEENQRGVISLGTCNNIISNHKSSGGQIYADLISHASITAGDTIVSLKEVTSSVSINMKKSGRVSIDILSGGLSSISTNSGDINLGTVISAINLRSESGNINVKNAFYTTTLIANYGDAKIHFDENAPSFKDNASARVLYAIIKNGRLTATGVEHIGEITNETGIKIQGTGTVSLTFKNVYGANSVSGGNGIANIIVNKNSAYVLKTQSAGGSIRVNLTQISEYNGYTTKELRTTNINCSSSSNTLSATTSKGYLTILDTNFA